MITQKTVSEIQDSKNKFKKAVEIALAELEAETGRIITVSSIDFRDLRDANEDVLDPTGHRIKVIYYKH